MKAKPKSKKKSDVKKMADKTFEGLKKAGMFKEKKKGKKK